jgi:hypothetical protein
MCRILLLRWFHSVLIEPGLESSISQHASAATPRRWKSRNSYTVEINTTVQELKGMLSIASSRLSSTNRASSVRILLLFFSRRHECLEPLCDDNLPLPQVYYEQPFRQETP